MNDPRSDARETRGRRNTRDTRDAPGGNRSGERRRPDRAGASSDRPRERRIEPELPDDITGRELPREVRAELGSLAALNRDAVARHLVMVARLLDSDPEAAYAHAMAAQRRAGRIGAVREAAGLAAYAAGRYAEALSELRAARRISGNDSVLPIMADCERGLGRPERALALAADLAVERLEPAARAELLIVTSGARRDLGQPEAAVQLLQGPHLRPDLGQPWASRLFYAYADALLATGRTDEALTWFSHAAAADAEAQTDADERLAELSGVSFHDDDGD